MEPIECYNALLAQKVIRELERRNMEGFYYNTKEDALKKVLDMIPKESLVSCGGSATLGEIGLKSALKAGGYNFLDPNDTQGAASKDQAAHRALEAEYYLMGCNAIAATGELVNADGYGNRVASLIFGPKNVIVIAGINKISCSLDAAVERLKTTAAPLILLHFKRDYTTYDGLVQAAEAACSQTVITRFSAAKGRIKVVLVGEQLGY